MWEKYIVSVDDGVVAIKYNLYSHKLIIGGFARYTDIMVLLINDYFKCKLPNPHMIQKNKVRFTCVCLYVVFRKALGELKDAGIIVDRVQNLYNIMR